MRKSIIYLKDKFGVCVNNSEIGFKIPEIYEVLEWYRENNIPIYGGDVYLNNGDKYISSDDNWYFLEKNTSYNFLEESIEYSLNYINNYPDKNNALFVLVPN